MTLVRIGAATDAAAAYRLPWDVAIDLLNANHDEPDEEELFQFPDGSFAPAGFSKMYAMLGMINPAKS